MNDYPWPKEVGGKFGFWSCPNYAHLLQKAEVGGECSRKVWIMHFLQAKQLALHFLNTHSLSHAHTRTHRHTSARMTVAMVTRQRQLWRDGGKYTRSSKGKPSHRPADFGNLSTCLSFLTCIHLLSLIPCVLSLSLSHYQLFCGCMLCVHHKVCDLLTARLMAQCVVFVWLCSSIRGLEVATCSFIILPPFCNLTPVTPVRYFCHTASHSFINPSHHKYIQTHTHTLHTYKYIADKFTKFILQAAILDRTKLEKNFP